MQLVNHNRPKRIFRKTQRSYIVRKPQLEQPELNLPTIAEFAAGAANLTLENGYHAVPDTDLVVDGLFGLEQEPYVFKPEFTSYERWSNEDVMQWFTDTTKKKSAKKRQTEALKQLLQEKRYGWKIIDRSGRVVAEVCVLDIERTHNRCTIGFLLTDPAYQGLGIGTAAVKAVTEWCFKVGFTVVRADVSTRNIPSRRCFEKSDFRIRAVRPFYMWRNKEDVEDMIQYQINLVEYQRLRSASPWQLRLIKLSNQRKNKKMLRLTV